MSFNKKGMTLIEIILAIALFGIIAVAFMSVFTFSNLWVGKAGARGEAYHVAQQGIEQELASRDAENFADLELIFNGKKYDVRGEYVQSVEDIRNVSSLMEAFIPYMPTILLNPRVRNEGEPPFTMTVNGKYTHFDNATTLIDLYDHTGKNKILSTSIIPTVIGQDELSFSLPNHLYLKNSDYIIEVTTKISGSLDEIARAKLTIEPPMLVIPQNNNILISSNGSHWFSRSGSPDSFPISAPNAIASNSRIFLAVGDLGWVLRSIDKAAWKTSNPVASNLTSVDWSPINQVFYVASADGTIFETSDGQLFAVKTSLSGSILNSITVAILADEYVQDHLVLAAGNQGLLTVSRNNGSWVSTTLSSELGLYPDFFSITAGKNGSNDVILAVGSAGMMTRSIDGINWSIPKQIIPGLDVNLNAITYQEATQTFIVVGDNGTVLRSQDSENWSLIDSGVETNLLSVSARSNLIAIVGVSGTVRYSLDTGLTWSSPSYLDGVSWTAPVDAINAVAAR